MSKIESAPSSSPSLAVLLGVNLGPKSRTPLVLCVLGYIRAKSLEILTRFGESKEGNQFPCVIPFQNQFRFNSLSTSNSSPSPLGRVSFFLYFSLSTSCVPVDCLPSTWTLLVDWVRTNRLVAWKGNSPCRLVTWS